MKIDHTLDRPRELYQEHEQRRAGFLMVSRVSAIDSFPEAVTASLEAIDLLARHEYKEALMNEDIFAEMEQEAK